MQQGSRQDAERRIRRADQRIQRRNGVGGAAAPHDGGAGARRTSSRGSSSGDHGMASGAGPRAAGRRGKSASLQLHDSAKEKLLGRGSKGGEGGC